MNSSPDELPLVSVVVPTFNVEKYIEQTIQSVLSQTYDNLEVICVDDFSTDATVGILRSIADKRLQIMVNETNMGAGASRNRGIAAANGRYVALLDSDDLWYPAKVQHQVEFAARMNAAAIYTNYDIIDRNGLVYDSSGHLPHSVDYRDLLQHCYIRTSSFMYDAQKVSREVKFTDARKRQDYMFFLAVIRSVGKAYLLPETTCSYRVHQESISSRKLKNIPFQWDVYRKYEKMSFARSMTHMAGWFFRSGAIVARRRVRAAMMRAKSKA